MTENKSKWSEEDMPILKAISKIMPTELIKDIQLSREEGNIVVVLHTINAPDLIGEQGKNVQDLYKAIKELTGMHSVINVLDLELE